MNFQVHMKTHGNEITHLENITSMCQLCDMTFESSVAYDEHYALVHSTAEGVKNEDGDADDVIQEDSESSATRSISKEPIFYTSSEITGL